jgi:hypothetical protein
MAKALTDLRMTVAEFALWHDGTDARHELVRGRVVAMAPPSGRHAVLARNLFRALDRQLRPPCGAMFGAGVAQDRRLIQLHAREGRRWTARDYAGSATVPLAGLGIALDLDEVYAGVDPSLDSGD